MGTNVKEQSALGRIDRYSPKIIDAIGGEQAKGNFQKDVGVILTTSGPGHLARHVFEGAENDEIATIQGSRADLADMVNDAEAKGAKFAIRHVVISPGETLTRTQAETVAAMWRAEFGAEGRPFILVEPSAIAFGQGGFDGPAQRFNGSGYQADIGSMQTSGDRLHRHDNICCPDQTFWFERSRDRDEKQTLCLRKDQSGLLQTHRVQRNSHPWHFAFVRRSATYAEWTTAISHPARPRGRSLPWKHWPIWLSTWNLPHAQCRKASAHSRLRTRHGWSWATSASGFA